MTQAAAEVLLHLVKTGFFQSVAVLLESLELMWWHNYEVKVLFLNWTMLNGAATIDFFLLSFYPSIFFRSICHNYLLSFHHLSLTAIKHSHLKPLKNNALLRSLTYFF